MKGNFLGKLQRLGRALMTPVAVMPAAALLLRLGAEDVLNWPWMANAGGAIFDNLPLLFAIGIAIGLADENNGVAGLAAAVGYWVLTNVATTFDAGIKRGGNICKHPGANSREIGRAHACTPVTGKTRMPS